MDKDGFVPLDVIGRFNRVRALTQNVQLIKEVRMAPHVLLARPRTCRFHVHFFLCAQSLLGSVLVELDGKKEKLRQKEGWRYWVVAPQEGGNNADPSAPQPSPLGPGVPSSSGGGGQDDLSLVAGDNMLGSAASEASDSVMVSVGAVVGVDSY